MPPPIRRITAPSQIRKRSISLAGHKTSISMEDEFWDGLRTLARLKEETLQTLIGQIDSQRGKLNLCSAIRLEILREARRGGLPQIMEKCRTQPSNSADAAAMVDTPKRRRFTIVIREPSRLSRSGRHSSASPA